MRKNLFLPFSLVVPTVGDSELWPYGIVCKQTTSLPELDGTREVPLLVLSLFATPLTVFVRSLGSWAGSLLQRPVFLGARPAEPALRRLLCGF